MENLGKRKIRLKYIKGFKKSENHLVDYCPGKDQIKKLKTVFSSQLDTVQSYQREFQLGN